MPEQRKTVLVVEHEKDLGTLFEAILRGHTVIVAETVEAGLEIALTEPVDIVFTDFVFPGETAERLVRTLKEMRPHLPIHIVTGGGMGYDAYAVGASSVIPKPFDINDIRRLVADLEEVPVPA